MAPLALIPAWVNNYTHYTVWDEITYPFPNFNGSTIEVWEWISNFILQSIVHVITYLHLIGLKLIHISKRSPRRFRRRGIGYRGERIALTLNGRPGSNAGQTTAHYQNDQAALSYSLRLFQHPIRRSLELSRIFA